MSTDLYIVSHILKLRKNYNLSIECQVDCQMCLAITQQKCIKSLFQFTIKNCKPIEEIFFFSPTFNLIPISVKNKRNCSLQKTVQAVLESSLFCELCPSLECNITACRGNKVDGEVFLLLQ